MDRGHVMVRACETATQMIEATIASMDFQQELIWCLPAVATEHTKTTPQSMRPHLRGIQRQRLVSVRGKKVAALISVTVRRRVTALAGPQAVQRVRKLMALTSFSLQRKTVAHKQATRTICNPASVVFHLTALRTVTITLPHRRPRPTATSPSRNPGE